MTKTKTAAIYCRISLKDEAVAKVEQQEEQCRTLAQAFGYDVVKVYTDDGISAYKDVERPGYEALLADVRAGKYDVILAVEESRFTRQGVGEKERLMLACVAGGACWHTTRDGFLDPDTDSGEFMSSLRALMDKQEMKKKTQRQRDRYADEQKEGNPLWGGRPFGYEVDRITIRKVEAKALKRAVNMILKEDATVYRVMQYLNDEVKLLSPRGNRWGTMTTKQLLTRPRNAGIYVVGGVEQDVKAAWKPIIDRDTHEALLLHFKVTGKTQPGRKPMYVGTGIIRCGMCGEVMRTGSSAGHPIFRCKTKTVNGTEAYNDGTRHVSIRAHYVEEAIRTQIINAFFLGSDVLSQSTTEGQELSALYAKIDKLDRQKRDLLNSVRGEDAVLTMADITPDLRELKTALEATEGRVEALRVEKAHAAMLDQIRRSMTFRDGDTHRVNMDAAGEVYAALSDRYDSLSLSTQKALLNDLLEVTILPSGRGAKKVRIRHKVVTSLNDEEEEIAA